MSELTQQQKLALLFVLLFAVMHLARDFLQDFGVHDFFTDFLHKDIGSNAYSYPVEIVLIALTSVAFSKKKFKPEGLAASVLLALAFVTWATMYYTKVH